jgi:hypothetical protein
MMKQSLDMGFAHIETSHFNPLSHEGIRAFANQATLLELG